MILGVADGLHASAALVVDDALVAVQSQDRLARESASRGMPWEAMRHVLEVEGLQPEQVDVVAVAGRFTPPLFLRRHPRLRQVTGEDAFSPAMDAHVFAQGLLRQTGFGAYEADRIQAWFESRLAGTGYGAPKVRMIDVHRALAEAAYRCQPEDDVLVLTGHPKGDGVSFAVHEGRRGQVRRLWAQRGYGALHVHIQRAAAALGLVPLVQEHLMWGAAARAAPDPELVAQLQGHLRAVGRGFSRQGSPLPEAGALWRALARSDHAVAAASVLANLTEAVLEVVRQNVAATGLARVALGGFVLDNPRLHAAVAALDDVEALCVGPPLGWDALAVGAAVSAAGTAPGLLPESGLGPRLDPRSVRAALRAAGLEAREVADAGITEAVQVLERGAALAVVRDRSGWAPTGSGCRSVLVRADDAPAVDAVRARLLRHADEEIGCAWLAADGDGRIRDLDVIGTGARFGSVALQVDDVFTRRYPGAVTWDGRAHLQVVGPDGWLGRVLARLRQRAGCGAVAVVPLAERDEPLCVAPEDALQAVTRSGLGAVVLGDHVAGIA